MFPAVPCQTYLITNGNSTSKTFRKELPGIISLIEKAVEARLSLIQIREKNITARQLFELAQIASSITKNSETKLLVNDRADIAFAAGADGVHLTSHSLPAHVIRENFPPEFIIGVSTHSLEEAVKAKNEGANFIVFGPVFATPSKAQYGEPLGINKVSEIVEALGDFPVFALGGIDKNNYHEVLSMGAAGVAGISMFYEMLG